MTFTTFAGLLTDEVFAPLVARLKTVVSTTTNLRPNWTFYIDDAKYNSGLAKWQLLA